MKGFVHVYTGNGKGKTTAAFGLALRASGVGLNVFIGQFIKEKSYGEIAAISQYLMNVKIKQYGLDCFIVNKPTSKDIEAAQNGFAEISDIIRKGKYDLVIMDEVNIALYYNLINLDTLIEVILSKPEHVELVLTGRYAPPSLIEKADLVTEMKEIKHYYSQGIEARKGIEY